LLLVCKNYVGLEKQLFLMIEQENPQLQLAYDFVVYTNKNIFLTGKAGTGKTTFLHNLKKNTPKRMVVVAPTGVAAINAGGVTMHSFFQLSFGPQLAHLISNSNASKDKRNEFVKKFSRDKIRLIKSMDLLVIDEISMVRADMLDAVDEVLRRFKDKNKPFGGVQLLMIGDLHQLSPIVKDDEWQLLREHYNTMYFFDSKALQQTNPISIELKHIYRQSDEHFINILGKIRNNIADKATLDALNKRYLPDFKPKDEEGYIILTTHNATAQDINKQKLSQLKTMASSFNADIDGDFPSYNFPTEENLELKVGAQVMFVKNDSKREKLFYNGKIGKIKSIEDDIIYVKSADDNTLIPVEKETWHNVKYSLNDETKEINENVIGSFKQYPLKLAWAITIHKSQGLTFDKAIIDAGAAFAFGQVYVALSRCRSFDGLVLRSPITPQCIKNDRFVADYTEDINRNMPGSQQLLEAKINFQHDLLVELFTFSDIQRRFFRLKKVFNENANILHNSVIGEMKQIETNLITDIFEVADKFNRQLSQLLLPDVIPESDASVKGRVQKASTYFIKKLDDIFYIQFKNILSDTDNKVINKTINEDIDNLQKEAFIKLACLKDSEKGFNAITYIKTKANADIDYKPASIKKQLKEDVFDYKNIPNPELYSLLKHWRQSLANEMNVPVFMILPQKSLAKLLVDLPATKAALLKIKGIGKIKANQFGNEILEIINEYCLEKGIEREPAVAEKPKLAKSLKESTHSISFKLFKEGKTVKEIAALQHFAESTIEGHLARYVGTGEIEVYRLVDKDKVKTICRFLENTQVTSLSDAKMALGKSVSYSELRFVLNYMKFKDS